jgi:DNA repair exonuclease SbcCD ATPase subunit
MKTIQKFLRFGICFAFFILFTGIASMAQEKIEVTNTQALMSKGPQTCYVVTVPQADLDIIQKNWIKKLQEGVKNKVKTVNQELVLGQVVKSEISTDTMNIYSLIIQREENRVIMNVFFEIGGVFFGPKEDKKDLVSDKTDNNIKNYLRAFAVDQYKLAVSNELEGEQKKLETMEDDLKKLEKNEESMTKDISSLENEIDKTEREIKDIEVNIDLKNKEILANNTSMLTITGEADKKAAQEKQKGLEKEKNKLEKSRSNAKDDISSYKSKIEKNEKNIEDGKKLQEDKQEEITQQTEVVKAVQAKLEGIK